MTCCSACSDDSSFVVPVEFGSALWLWACVCVSGGHFECRNEREFWNCVAGGRAVRKAEVGLRPAWESWTHECHMPGGYGQWDFGFPLLSQG